MSTGASATRAIGKNVAVELTGTTLLVVHTSFAPDDADWEIFLSIWRAHRDEIRAQLVFTTGGGPNAEQRHSSLEIINGRPGGAPPTAVVTGSIAVRGIVTALSWVVKSTIRAFAPHELVKACEFLEIAAPADRQAIIDRVMKLRRELSPQLVQIGD